MAQAARKENTFKRLLPPDRRVHQECRPCGMFLCQPKVPPSTLEDIWTLLDTGTLVIIKTQWPELRWCDGGLGQSTEHPDPLYWFYQFTQFQITTTLFSTVYLQPNVLPSVFFIMKIYIADPFFFCLQVFVVDFSKDWIDSLT